MCTIYNSIGSLTTLKKHLDWYRIDFKSLKEIIDFQNSYLTLKQQIITDHQILIDQERKTLELDIQQLEAIIVNQKYQLEKDLNEEIEKLYEKLNIVLTCVPRNYFQRIEKYLKGWYYPKKIKTNKRNLEFKINKSINDLINLQQVKTNRYQFILSQFGDAVKQSSHQHLSELERKKKIIDELSSFIYGALGEQKVVKTLESLPNDYYLINDFAISFTKPIYNRNENAYIKSIQLDHILIAPSGIFLIETKNWSEKSIENLSLRSPVQQIKRSSFVLFKLLNNEMTNYHLHLDKHHWGERKIPIKNLIVMINKKPKEEFQFVKTLTLNELIGYVQYFKPIFSSYETRTVTDYLLNINNQKTIVVNRINK